MNDADTICTVLWCECGYCFFLLLRLRCPIWLYLPLSVRNVMILVRGWEQSISNMLWWSLLTFRLLYVCLCVIVNAVIHADTLTRTHRRCRTGRCAQRTLCVTIFVFTYMVKCKMQKNDVWGLVIPIWRYTITFHVDLYSL